MLHGKVAALRRVTQGRRDQKYRAKQEKDNTVEAGGEMQPSDVFNVQEME